MFKTVCKLRAPTSSGYKPPFQLAHPRTRPYPRVSPISSTARAGLSHVSPRYISVPAVTPEPSAPVEVAPYPSSQGSDTPPQPRTLQSSSHKSPAKKINTVPKPRDEIALPQQSSGVSDSGTNKEKAPKLIAEKTESELESPNDELDTKPDAKSKGDLSLDEKVAEIRREVWGKWDLNHRPKSQFELDLRYNQDLQVLPTHLQPIEPPIDLFELFSNNRTREMEYMYMAINKSIKIVQQTIKYEFKNPMILWGALQHYNITGPDFYPYSTRTGGNAGLAQVGSSLLHLAMVIEGYGKMAPTEAVAVAKNAGLSNRHLARLAIQKDIHRHIYRYDIDKPLRNEAIARTFSAIIGAVWFDSGESMTDVYQCMSAMGLEWPKNLFHSW